MLLKNVGKHDSILLEQIADYFHQMMSFDDVIFCLIVACGYWITESMGSKINKQLIQTLYINRTREKPSH